MPARKSGLTPKQGRFVQEYLLDLNATAAYKRAGYKARTDAVAASGASELLRNPKVSAAVSAAVAERATKADLTALYVIKGLQREAELTGEGGSSAARVSALKALGEHLGMFPQRHKHEHTGEGGGPIQHEVLTDAQRASAVERLYAAVGRRAGTVPANGAASSIGPPVG